MKKVQFPIYERFDKVRTDIINLRLQIHNLIAEFVPAHYVANDVRIIPYAIYRKARVLFEQADDLEAILNRRPSNFGPKRIVFMGPLGPLEVRPSTADRTADFQR